LPRTGFRQSVGETNIVGFRQRADFFGDVSAQLLFQFFASLPPAFDVTKAAIA
jgi:hypothetical protein